MNLAIRDHEAIRKPREFPEHVAHTPLCGANPQFVSSSFDEKIYLDVISYPERLNLSVRDNSLTPSLSVCYEAFIFDC